VEPVVSSVSIARPREEIFEYLADVANHAEFTDHFLVEWHLLREDSYGEGAGARYRVKRGNRFDFGDFTLAEVDPPYRILERGRSGKFNRVRTIGVWTLQDGPAGTTRVEYSFETQPVMLSDHLIDLLGRGKRKRKQAKALRRLQAILEENRDRGRRMTIAGS
jgi:Polyketide cyclase / dehydrase and lipid transport